MYSNTQVGVFKWSIPLSEFGIGISTDNTQYKANKEAVNILEKYGAEVFHVNFVGAASVRLTGIIEDDSKFDEKEMRREVSECLEFIANDLDDVKTVKLMMLTIASYIKNNSPISKKMGNVQGTAIFANADFMMEFEKELFYKITTNKNILHEIRNKIHSNIIAWMDKEYGNISKEHEEEESSVVAVMMKELEEKYTSPTTTGDIFIREVSKIVVHNERNWSVTYSVKMDETERYIHRITVTDFMDDNNTLHKEYKTSSPFIKDLDKKIKSKINDLEKNLWTVDKFEKWDGNLK